MKLDALAELNSELVKCRKCPRLVAWREEVARVKRRAYQDQDYWGKPVPGFGDPQARLMIVGLAPGAHGSNRTGRMFTGDASGNFLYPALHRAGFANGTEGIYVGDGLALQDAYISAICRCAPPQNKPTRVEITNCLPWLQREVACLGNLDGFVALGKIAFDGLAWMYQRQGHQLPKMAFAHGAFYQPGEGLPWLLCSYHPSQQNTLTGRLTEAMFDAIWQQARGILDDHSDSSL